MSQKTYTNAGPIYTTTAQYANLVTAGTVEPGREYVIVDSVVPELFSGTTDPTTATTCNKVGDLYINTTSGDTWKCTAVDTSTPAYTWVKMIGENNLHAGSTTLDSTLVAGKQYILASQSATFEMVLPTTGTYNDEIEVVFAATAAFTPTVSSSGGTVVGDSLPQTTAGKTYDFLFSWVGSGWLLNWLAF